MDSVVLKSATDSFEFGCEVYRHATPKGTVACPASLWFTLLAFADALYPRTALQKRRNLIGRMAPAWVKVMKKFGSEGAEHHHLRRSAKSLGAIHRASSSAAPASDVCLSSEQEFSVSPMGFMYLCCGIHTCKKYTTLQANCTQGVAADVLECFLSFWLRPTTIHFVTRDGVVVVFQRGSLLLEPLLSSCDADRYSPFRHIFVDGNDLRPSDFLLGLARDIVGSRRTPAWHEKVPSLLQEVVAWLAKFMEVTKDRNIWEQHVHFSLRILRGAKRPFRISVARKLAFHTAVSQNKRVKRVSTLVAAQQLVGEQVTPGGKFDGLEKHTTCEGYLKSAMFNYWLALRKSGAQTLRLSISLDGTRVSGHEVVNYACWNQDLAAACWLPSQVLGWGWGARMAESCCTFRVCLWVCHLRVCWAAAARVVI